MMQKLSILWVISFVLLVSCGKPADEPTPTATLPPLEATKTQTAVSTATKMAPAPPESAATLEAEIEQVVPEQTSATFETGACQFTVPEGEEIECGFVIVPEDHNDPHGATIKLAVVVYRDQSENH